MEPTKTKDIIVHTDNWPTANEQILIKAREYGEAGQELKTREQITCDPPNETAVNGAGRRLHRVKEDGSLTEGATIMFSEDVKNHRRRER